MKTKKLAKEHVDILSSWQLWVAAMGIGLKDYSQEEFVDKTSKFIRALLAAKDAEKAVVEDQLKEALGRLELNPLD